MSDTDPDTSSDLNATEARQGWRSNRIIWVLAIGLVLVIGAFVVIAATSAGNLTGGSGGQEIASPQAAAAFDAPEPAPKQTDEVKAPGVPGEQSPSPSASQPPAN